MIPRFSPTYHAYYGKIEGVFFYLLVDFVFSCPIREKTRQNDRTVAKLHPQNQQNHRKMEVFQSRRVLAGWRAEQEKNKFVVRELHQIGVEKMRK